MHRWWYGSRRLAALTLERGTDALPQREAAAAVELPQRQLHEEQRQPPEHQHHAVWDQERPCRGGRHQGETNNILIIIIIHGSISQTAINKKKT